MPFEVKDSRGSSYQGLDQTVYSLNLLLNPTEVIEKIRHTFLGEEIDGDPRDNRYKKIGKPLMDEEGIRELMLLLTGTISVPIVLGNLNEKEYKKIVSSIGYTVTDFIFFNSQKYHIAHANYSLIFNIIMTDFKTFLSRARGGFQQVHVSKAYGAHEVVEQRHSSNDEKKDRLI